jgi:hypothetical protein
MVIHLVYYQILWQIVFYGKHQKDNLIVMFQILKQEIVADKLTEIITLYYILCCNMI